MAQINEWIEISNTSGEGDATITLTASTYTELTDRVANLKVSTRTKTVYVNIKQTAFEPSLSLSYNTLVFNQNELQDTITVTSNVAWTAEPSADWITLSQTSGDSGSTTIIIEVDTIGINESRTGYITFYYGNNRQTIVVSQAYELEFNVNPTSVDLTNSAKTITITSNVDWTATTTDDWYTLSTTSGASGTSTITVTPSTTDVSEDIFGSIDFYSGGVKIGSVAVIQLIIAEGQFYFEPIEDNFSLELNSGLNATAEYKIGDGDWTTFNGSVSSSPNEKIYVRNLNYENILNITSPFKTFNKYNVGGNITTLLGDMKEKYARNLFRSSGGLINAKDLILPATTLAEYCYCSMFDSCDSLITAPELPATTLAGWCYSYMFAGCSSLTTAPELPITTLEKYCYEGMFSYCASLTTAPELPATNLAKGCYSSMFSVCDFRTAPELPATTLADSCYYRMFASCINLTRAPELPATTLAERCYYEMFHYCSYLNYIKMLATDISAEDCLYRWVYRVPMQGTFVKNSNMNDLPTGNSGIPSGWKVQNA